MDNIVKKIMVPDTDCDVILVFPSGKEIVIKSRPRACFPGENIPDRVLTTIVVQDGSFDIILPYNMTTVHWPEHIRCSIKGPTFSPLKKSLNGPDPEPIP